MHGPMNVKSMCQIYFFIFLHFSTNEIHNTSYHWQQNSRLLTNFDIGVNGIPIQLEIYIHYMSVFLNRWAMAQYCALASIIPSHERFSWNW